MSRRGRSTALALGAVGAAGGLAVAFALRRTGTSGDGAGLEPAKPLDVPAQRAERHRSQRPIMREAARRALGREPLLAEVQYLHAIAWLESSYGRGWKEPMNSSNNYGAIQCPSGGGADCLLYTDSRADGSKYEVSFRRYATPEDGAADLARHVFKLRPSVEEGLKLPGATAFRASLAMRRQPGKPYYEGFCPKATKAHGSDAARASLRTPDRDAGTLACEREAVEAHAKRSAEIIAEVAASCGDTERLRLGSFDEALAWWRSRTPNT